MSQPTASVAPRQDDPPYKPGDPVALFIPCYIDQFYPKIAQATADLLKRYGVPFEQQQFAALDAERAGVLVMDEGELAALAGRIAQAISVSGAGTGGRP